MQCLIATKLSEWPGPVDRILLLVFLTMVVLLPGIGYWLMIIDIRAYYRALKGALMVVRNHLPTIPEWAKQHTPGCLRSLGLEMPCDEHDVKRAYRGLAEKLHPDRGGDRRRFMRLQQQFEDALRYVREQTTRK